MSLFIAIVSQKGGVGKSTIARMLAREYTMAGWEVKIADMDIAQATCTNWNRRREHFGVTPAFSVEPYGDTRRAFNTPGFDLIIFDGAPNSDRQTLQITQKSHLIIIPTGTSLDDLEPSIKLAHELRKKGIDKQRILLVLNNVSGTEAEVEEAVNYIKDTGYPLADSYIPDRTAIRRAQDMGKAATETGFASVNEKVAVVAQYIINRIEELN